MSRALSFVLALAVVLPACTKKQTAPQPARLTSETISDDSGEVQVGIDYLPKGDSIDLIVELKGIGTTEMDKIVVEVATTGFVFVAGESQWGGFVPPMTKHKHQVSLKAEAGVEFATVTVTVSRSVDSRVLMQTEVPFQVSGGQVVPDN